MPKNKRKEKRKKLPAEFFTFLKNDLNFDLDNSLSLEPIFNNTKYPT